MGMPAYIPMGPPVWCMTPGHEDREARLYPGGHLCKDCIRAVADARNAMPDDPVPYSPRRPP